MEDKNIAKQEDFARMRAKSVDDNKSGFSACRNQDIRG